MATRRKKAKPPAVPPETKAADAVTVAWMLAVTCALMCEVSTGLLRAYLTFVPDGPKVALLAELLLFAALVAGIVSLLILPVVLKVRRLAPPRPVTIVSVVVGVAPLIAYLTRSLR